jgi:hypothetical protein
MGVSLWLHLNGARITSNYVVADDRAVQAMKDGDLGSNLDGDLGRIWGQIFILDFGFGIW